MCLKPNVERGNVKAYIPANFGTHSLQSVAIQNMNRGRLNELFSFSPRSELYAVRFSEFFDLLLGTILKLGDLEIFQKLILNTLVVFLRDIFLLDRLRPK